MPILYADIAFPTAARQLFTYETRDPAIRPGMRVWVPLRKEYAIGMVVQVHENRPDFKTRPVERILDQHPVMDKKMLQLTQWIHRFYYCSWGEAIQAALPVGLNFSSEKVLKVKKGYKSDPDADDLELLKELENQTYTLNEAEKRWRDGTDKKRLKKAIKRGWVTLWEEPRQRVDYKKVKHWQLSESFDAEEIKENLSDEDRGNKWVLAYLELLEMDLPLPHRELLDHNLFTAYTLKRIEKEGWIESVDLPVKGDEVEKGVHQPELIKTLSDQQQNAYEQIRNVLDSREFKSFLLFGVTGSGKTEVYIHALKHALEQGRGGLVLVPEIALTPQTVQRFFQIFGDQIAVLHSRMSERERFEAWKSLKSGEKRIAIGPRSAVFAPVQNVGLIVVDEEHDTSYKQYDPAPRYNARDVAVMRAHMENAAVVLGSATPGMVSVKAVKEEKHELLHLPLRPTGTMPEVRILNMIEYKSAMRGPLTVELHQEIEKSLDRKEQAILLFNRRGYASYMQCEDCGHIPQSPESSTSLTYHKKKNILLCHYSGYSRRADTQCELCGSDNLKTKGSGTQQVEEEIAELFPDARLLRMDRDTTSGKHGHQKIYQTFLNGEADILIGTQIVAKGLDFPNVTIVGVINADTELAFPSFRSGERMYQLLSQVAGRAGRAEKPGVVYVQTWKPEHPAIKCAKTHDFKAFSRQELASREMLMFPPFSRMVVFQFKSSSWSRVQLIAEKFCDAIRMVIGDEPVSGPSPSVIEWMNGLYRWEANIKMSRNFNAKQIEHILNGIFNRYDKMKPKGASTVRINVDVDAVE
ncbi:primosomal protein N' [Rhodohalobacter sp. SW132]|uniref:replication restart helicase PriA n=1 Tax=Rhodohalobacter sp. SW132 TaxID=2293433 RepID=UPI000E21E3A6|nr:primosomal protein N' [Rhodohalobacter sp. SW132]REL33491.1 primosomal protein N' [Rhodohalobacter sp. SW132]